MTIAVYCRNVRFDYEGVNCTKNEEEALILVAKHTKEVHGSEEISPPPDILTSYSRFEKSADGYNPLHD